MQATGRRGDCGNPLDAARDALRTFHPHYGRTGCCRKMVYLRRSLADEVVTHPAMPP
jgi:hypothetical protein